MKDQSKTALLLDVDSLQIDRVKLDERTFVVKTAALSPREARPRAFYSDYLGRAG
jgi:hypothetical protein